MAIFQTREGAQRADQAAKESACPASSEATIEPQESGQVEPSRRQFLAGHFAVAPRKLTELTRHPAQNAARL